MNNQMRSEISSILQPWGKRKFSLRFSIVVVLTSLCFNDVLLWISSVDSIIRSWNVQTEPRFNNRKLNGLIKKAMPYLDIWIFISRVAKSLGENYKFYSRNKVAKFCDIINFRYSVHPWKWIKESFFVPWFTISSDWLTITPRNHMVVYFCLSGAIDGGFATWTSWTTCSESTYCLQGSSSRTRSCTNPTPANGGDDCVGLSEDKRDCPTEADGCSGISNSWLGHRIGNLSVI